MRTCVFSKVVRESMIFLGWCLTHYISFGFLVSLNDRNNTILRGSLSSKRIWDGSVSVSAVQTIGRNCFLFQEVSGTYPMFCCNECFQAVRSLSARAQIAKCVCVCVSPTTASTLNELTSVRALQAPGVGEKPVWCSPYISDVSCLSQTT